MDFLFIYVQEAHPTDGWQVDSNVADGVLLASHSSLNERADAARACVARLGITMPVALDGLNSAADHAFNAWPERLLLLGNSGRVLFQGGKGPYGFHPAELGSAIEAMNPAVTD